ncbi:D-2-hydroxyacid dehydrogenase [Mesorhizobium sp. M2E.F.Ca.ET.209.01.1.1]|uniref:D-2-hydroxyacid dehydrogenase n=1 Tax=Mesorhizobium sp. M2E.F.Ca.ET.209.01.1.1 TaxID=2500526 RepID=UPI000FD92619|nr:D-2-hydroxyacid dehydrogenase [Mesorhizobium sp. M2E.F.Ca.ET.209.01.1.1]TGS14291.1 D-2-hydroxyacid dehydrogenase [Mesorhizobium sp. M2E.F.Ca.ET.209.01.1.1]
MINFVFVPPQSDVSRAFGAQLRRDVEGMVVHVPETEAEAIAYLADADAAFGALSPELLQHARKLRWLHSRQIAPPPGYFHEALIEHPVIVTNTREVYNDHIGAHILAFVLSLSRDLPYYHTEQLKGRWAPKPLNSGVVFLPEATALIVGVGGIGAEAGRMLSAFGTRIVGIDARRTSVPPGFAEIHGVEALNDLLPSADFVILTVPHTPHTEGMMNLDRFRRMKTSGFFINIGRGLTTRLDDLVVALKEGSLAGAALDVFDQEPLPEGHALWGIPNVLITPHMAGFGPYLEKRRYTILRDNCLAFVQGRPLANIVQKQSWF